MEIKRKQQEQKLEMKERRKDFLIANTVKKKM